MQAENKTVAAIIVAAGSSSRMSAGDKLFMNISSKPCLAHTLLAFQKSEVVDGIIVVTRRESLEKVRSLAKEYGIEKLKAVTEGGCCRAESVLCGIKKAEGYDILLIHDGARPLVSGELIYSVALSAGEYGAAIPCLPVKDTIKAVQNGFVESTPERASLYAVQTPQGFSIKLYQRAAEIYEGELAALTDDSMLFEAAGYRVKTVEGEHENIKITTDSDIAVAERFLGGSV